MRLLARVLLVFPPSLISILLLICKPNPNADQSLTISNRTHVYGALVERLQIIKAARAAQVVAPSAR